MEDVKSYIEGISKSSFCKPKWQYHISFAHFLSLQPRECVKVRDEFYPDAVIVKNILYVWLPTPPKKNMDQDKYASECRKRLVEVTKGATFSEIMFDVRGNIGGVLSTVVNAVYPIIADRLSGKYLSGISKAGDEVTTFELIDGMHILNPSGDVMKTVMLPVEAELRDIFAGKPINALCNRFTMSTGEIMCIIVRKLGGIIYGEHTRGLTNGMEVISNSKVKSALIPYYYIADGDKKYLNGVEPDLPEANFLRTLN